MATIIIPARKGSVRLPGKPLLLVKGVPLIVRVYEQAVAADVGPVFVTSDSHEILALIPHQRGVYTSPDCPTGTDRVAAAARVLQCKDEVIINVQGDMPFVSPSLIWDFANFMEETKFQMGTVAIPTSGPVPPGFVSVVTDAFNNAVYFSRSRQADLTNGHEAPSLRHVGMYGFRAPELQVFSCYGESPLERQENLEQLRVIYYDMFPIKVMPTLEDPGPEINTLQDLTEVNNAR